MKFSIRTLSTFVAVIATVLAFGTAIHRARLNAGRVDQGQWPDELLTIIDQNAILATHVDVRFGGAFVSRIWKMPASESVISAHVDQFKLQAVSATGPEIEQVRSSLPRAWKWPEHSNVLCYA